LRARRRARAAWLALGLALATIVSFAWSLRIGPIDLDLPTLARGVASHLGLLEPLEAGQRTIVDLRLWRALTTIGVGAALALSGALLQGMFRNPLASPSLLGVTAGASLGAALAVLALSGYAPRLVLEEPGGAAALAIPVFAFAGALATAGLVTLLAASGGRISTTSLLLIGLAVNMTVAGLFTAVQALSLERWEVSKAILSWTFGTLDDRSGRHALVAALGALAAAAVSPFVARELDLMQSGEADARSLGVDTGRVKLVCLVAAAFAASTAVSVAGQIAFVGLIVPHVVRALAGARHFALLFLSALGGAALLLGTDTFQRALLGAGALPPGVAMSLVGGPFFVFLLVRRRSEIRAW
jgi:iron complex transport system permease protein